MQALGVDRKEGQALEDNRKVCVCVCVFKFQDRGRRRDVKLSLPLGNKNERKKKWSLLLQSTTLYLMIN
jgi:hypothetical protein